MATHHGGTGQPSDREDAQQGQDTDITNDYHHEDIDSFENAEEEYHTTLKPLPEIWMIYATEFKLVKVSPWKPSIT